MSNRHGDFIWYELMTTDTAAARAFYQAVVGWHIEAQPSGDMDYRMIASAGGPVAGLLPIDEAMAANGAGPAWLGYVLVDDVDAMTGLIRDGGGAIHREPHSIPGVGRMAFVADPQGAMLYIMKPTPPSGDPDAASNSFSYDRPRDGHIAWNELATGDPEGALAFYDRSLGWVKDGEMPMGSMGPYHFIRAGGAAHGGSPGQGLIGAVYANVAAAAESHWLYYVRVPDIDRAVAIIAEKGGSLVQQPVEIPGGDFSLVAVDPQGAAFGLVGGRKG